MKNNFLLIFIFCLVVFTIGCATPPPLLTSLDKKNNEMSAETKNLGSVDRYVGILPIEIKEPEKQDKNDKKRSIKLDPYILEDELLLALKDYSVFEKTIEFPGGLTQEEINAKAKKIKVPILMKVTINGAFIEHKGGSEATAGNTILWGTLGFLPSMATHDQVYTVRIDGEVSFFDLTSDGENERKEESQLASADVLSSSNGESIFGDTAKDENKLTYGKRLGPADSPYKISVQSEGGLSLSERGFTFAIFLVPPQWCSENWEKINDAISPKLSRLFMRQLAEKIKSEYWGEPSTEVETEKADPETPEKVTPDNFDDFLEELFPGE